MMYESMNPSSPPLQHDTWMSLFSTVLLVSVITLLHTKITTKKKKPRNKAICRTTLLIGD